MVFHTFKFCFVCQSIESKIESKSVKKDSKTAINKLIYSFLAQKYKTNVNKSDDIKILKPEFVGEVIESMKSSRGSCIHKRVVLYSSGN